MKLPSIKLDVPKPRLWDLITMAVVVLGAVAAALNWSSAASKQIGTSLANGTTFAFVMVHLAVCLGSLMLLGKTSKEGTIWGNLAAVVGTFVGMSGVLLAAALWAAA